MTPPPMYDPAYVGETQAEWRRRGPFSDLYDSLPEAPIAPEPAESYSRSNLGRKLVSASVLAAALTIGALSCDTNESSLAQSSIVPAVYVSPGQAFGTGVGLLSAYVLASAAGREMKRKRRAQELAPVIPYKDR